MKLPIRIRLTVWYVLLLTAIFVGLGSFVVLQLRADLTDALDRDLRADAVQIARGYQFEGSEDFVDVSGTVLSGATSAAQVLDPQGRILYSYGEPIASSIAPVEARANTLRGQDRLLTVRLDGERHRVLVLRVNRRGHVRLLAVAESLHKVDESVQRVLILLLLAGPAALIATALGGWWLARKALLPVERMARQAEAIGIDRLDERISPPGIEDEIGHLALTLNAMLDRLERGVVEKHRVVADAAHELRTPLTAMRTELEVTLGDDGLDPAARAVLESALEEVEGMSRTVENLLTLARVDEGRLELLTARLDLLDASESAVEPLRPIAAAKGLWLEVEGQHCEATADPQRLEQALKNFVENAIKFSPPGSGVRVTVWCRDDEVGMTVADDGPGIAAEHRERVFDRFYRVDPARGRNAGGSGLGLAICREIAVAHGGRVWLESEPGKGSAFTLALPRTRQTGLAEPRVPAVT
jgi:heavy metal sensor kinase